MDNSADITKVNYLMNAIKVGDIAALQYFIEQGSSLDIVDSSGYPMFYHAILSENPSLINFFINNLKTVKEINASERLHLSITPLGATAQYASKFGDTNAFSFLKRLIAAGARLNPDNSSSPMVDAIESDGPFAYEVLKFFIENDNREVRSFEAPLLAAVKMGNEKIVELLLKNFANIAITEPKNCNYIIKEAIISENLENLQRLIYYSELLKVPFDKDVMIQEIINHYHNDFSKITKCLNFLKIDYSFRHGNFVLTTQDYGNESRRTANTPNIKQLSKTCIIDQKLCSSDTRKIIDHSNIPEREQLPLYVIDKKGNIFVGHSSNHSFFLKGKQGKTLLGSTSFYGYGKPVACAGHIRLKDGLIVQIDNHSGHYRPSNDQLKLVCKHLYDQGLLSPNFVAKDNLNNVFINSDILKELDINSILSKYPSIEKENLEKKNKQINTIFLPSYGKKIDVESLARVKTLDLSDNTKENNRSPKNKT